MGWRVALPPSRHARLADFGVAVMAPIHWLPLDAEIAAALDGLAGRLGRLAVQVKTAQLHLTLLATMTSARLPADRRAQRLEVLRVNGRPRRATRGHPYGASAAT